MSNWEFNNNPKVAEIVTYKPKGDFSIICNAEEEIIVVEVTNYLGKAIVKKEIERFDKILTPKKYKKTYSQNGWTQWTKKYSDVRDITSESKVWQEASLAYNNKSIPKENVEQIRNHFINSLNESIERPSFLDFMSEAIMFKDATYKKAVMKHHTIVTHDNKGKIFRSSEFHKKDFRNVRQSQIEEYSKRGTTFHVLNDDDYVFIKGNFETLLDMNEGKKTMVVSFMDGSNKTEGVVVEEYIVDGDKVVDIESKTRLHKGIPLEDVEFEYYLKENKLALESILEELSLTKSINYFKGISITAKDNGWLIQSEEDRPRMLGFVKKGADSRKTKRKVAEILLDNQGIFNLNPHKQKDIVGRSHSYNHFLLRKDVNESADELDAILEETMLNMYNGKLLDFINKRGLREIYDDYGFSTTSVDEQLPSTLHADHNGLYVNINVKDPNSRRKSSVSVKVDKTNYKEILRFT